MNLKYVKLPEDHGYDEQHLKFLETLDTALEGAVKGASSKKDIEEVKGDLAKQLAELKSEFNYELMKEQLAELYKKIDPLARTPRTVEQEKEQVRAMSSKWMRAFLKKDLQSMKQMQMEQKTFLWPQHVLHTGDNALIDDGDSGQGGYLIPELLETEIHRYVEESGIARQEMRYMPFGGPGNTRKHLFEANGVSVSWVDEGEIKPKTKPTFGYVNQTLRVLAAIVIMSEEIIEDAAIDLVAYCSQVLGEAIAEEEDVQFFTGVGAPWTGVINAANVIPVPLPATMVNAGDVTPTDLITGVLALSKSRRRGAKFYMHSSVLAALQTYRADAVAAGDQAGNYLVTHPTAGAPATIGGYPAVTLDVLPDLDTAQGAGTPFMFFANLQRTSVYGDKKGIRVKLLTEATLTDAGGNPINLAEQDMLALRVHKRVGYVNVLPSGIAVFETGPVT